MTTRQFLISILVYLSVYVVGCAEPDRAVHPANNVLLAQRAEYDLLADTSRVQLATDDEPGRRLIVLGQLVSSETGEPIPHYPIQLYHADSTGAYGAGGEGAARLSGRVVSDSLGRFLISTILPAGYGSGTQILGSGHIHTSVEGARPEAYDYFFRQGISRGLLRWANGTDQAVVLDLKTIDGDTLLASGTLTVRGLENPEP